VSYLLDTNVLSEWRRPTPDQGVMEWLDIVEPDELFLSVITVGELRRGVVMLQRRSAHRTATALERWLKATLQLFADRVAPVSLEIALEWGACGARGSVPIADGLIGATARVHGWTVVTRNTKNFELTGARLLNPFTG
jgi:predicted nucleic acid-binding protein